MKENSWGFHQNTVGQFKFSALLIQNKLSCKKPYMVVAMHRIGPSSSTAEIR
jgi:hypothetical protein